MAAKIFFLLSILLLYSALHLYIFIKIRGAFHFGTPTFILVICFMAFMIFAPILVHMSERLGLENLACPLSYAGYTWLGLVFLFFFFSLAVDIYRLFVHASGPVLRINISHLTPSPQIALFITVLLTVGVAIYGHFEARSIRCETLTVRNKKIPKDMGGLTIAQISDIHLGLIVRESRLKRILAEVKKARPDILISTGDLVDGQMDNLAGLAELLKGINARYGKFAVTGNHEFFAGLEHALSFMEDAGFTVLRGETATAGGMISIAGVDDPTGKYFGHYKEILEKTLLSGLPKHRFTLLLKHVPVIDKNALGLFDLQLSGHTHNGQIFPFNLVVRLFFPKNAGLFHLPHNALLYVSRGSGTWGPPIRFLSPPEVTIIRLVHEETPS
ncbi:MAG: metallophosphoesterase [Deltaproteobacteria bacterium]|nr:MAG: metallophosphoesterase [Deltaproteobacteria bacterium]